MQKTLFLHEGVAFQCILYSIQFYLKAILNSGKAANHLISMMIEMQAEQSEFPGNKRSLKRNV